jgi:acetyl-CoA carboxylase biotin carboxyl carrier protein
MDINIVEQLADLLIAKGLTAIEAEQDGLRVRVEKTGQTVSVYSAVSAPSQEVPFRTDAPQPAVEEPVRSDLLEVASPLVGVVYLAPSPESESYVSQGDRVKRGQVLCIVEAMKMLNEIASPVDGIVEEICVENEAVVDYGACLFRLKEV